MLCLLPSCAARGLYSWGSYDASIDRLYNSDAFELDIEIETLATELEQTRPEKIPPGKAAYVGYLYSLKDDLKMSRNFLELEKKIYPESSVFIDGLIKRGPALPTRKK